MWSIAQTCTPAVMIVLASAESGGVATRNTEISAGCAARLASGSNYALFFDQSRDQQSASRCGNKIAIATTRREALELA